MPEGVTDSMQSFKQNLTFLSIIVACGLYFAGDIIHYVAGAKHRALEALTAERYSTANLLKTYYQHSVPTGSQENKNDQAQVDTLPTKHQIIDHTCTEGKCSSKGNKGGKLASDNYHLSQDGGISSLRRVQTWDAPLSKAQSIQSQSGSSSQSVTEVGNIEKELPDFKHLKETKASKHDFEVISTPQELRGLQETNLTDSDLKGQNGHNSRRYSDRIEMLPVNINRLRSSSARSAKGRRALPDRFENESKTKGIIYGQASLDHDDNALNNVAPSTGMKSSPETCCFNLEKWVDFATNTRGSCASANGAFDVYSKRETQLNQHYLNSSSAPSLHDQTRSKDALTATDGVSGRTKRHLSDELQEKALDLSKK